MASSVGEIGLDLVVNQGSFNRQMQGIAGTAKKAGLALAAAFSVKKLVDFGKSCVDLGSDLAEVQNVVDVTFPHMTAQVDKFAKSAASSFGLSETMAKQFTGTFGAMAKAFGFSESAAYDMSTALTGLAGDVASFYNLSQEEAYTKLKSVFTGETESLKDLGVVMTQSALDAYAMANGFGKATKDMTEMEKVALRYAFVQNQLSAASGDFARTADSWANQTRILKLQFDSLKATIGQGLINVLTPVLKVINQLLAKLMTLASAFKSFTEMLTGNKSDGGISNATAGLTDATAAADGMADSTAGIGEAAKKAAKELNLMGFDKIQKVKSSSDSGSGSSGTSIGGNVDYGALAEGETVVDKLDKKFVSMFENIQKRIQPTVDSLKRLWNEGLAKFGDFTWTALKDFYDRFLVPVGKWTFGEGIPHFIDSLNNGLLAVDWEKINSVLKNLWNALAPFAINVGEGLLWLWENVLVPLGTWTANEVVPRFFNTLATAIDILNNIIEALKPLFEWFLESVLKPIAQWTGGVFMTVWDGIISVLKAFSDWCKEHPGTIQNIAIIIGSFFAAWKITQFVSAAAGFIETAINIVSSIRSISGAISLVKYAFSTLISAVNPVVLAIGAAIAIGILLYKNWDEISAKAKEVWDFIKQKFQAFDEWLSGVFSKDWTKNFGVFGDVFNAFFKNISNVWNSIKKIFNGIIDFVKNVFKGEWKKAWESVKDIFKGILDLMASIIKAPINLIIGAINSLVSGVVSGLNLVISAMNKLSFDVPDWIPGIGGETFGFNIGKITAPKIPYLAQGGFVKANTPRLAVIGDNRQHGEIVAPEDKMQAMVDAAVRAAGSRGITKADLESVMNNAVMRIIAALASMGFYVDGEELAKAVLKAIDRLDNRMNPVKVY